MVDDTEPVELSIDTAGAISGVTISRRGALLAELSWHTHNNQSAELLPAVGTVLAQARLEREQIGAVFVDRGPGSYGGLRVGISTAMGLALGLSADLLSAGRLELDAYAHAAFRGPICAVHQAGRGDLAWAVYQLEGDEWREFQPPRLSTLAEFLTAAPSDALFCGELGGIEPSLRQEKPGARSATFPGSGRRCAALADLCWRRYERGERDNPMALEPLYLREPLITLAKKASLA